MKLTCKNCGMRFHIEDQLVRGKLVRFRCRQCLATLEAHLPCQDPPPLTLMPANPPQPPPAPAPQTSGPPPLRLTQWFLSVSGNIVGPMNLAELNARIQQGEAQPSDLVWRTGLEGWIPISMAYELSSALANPINLTRNPSQTLMAFNPADTSNLVAIQHAPVQGFYALHPPPSPRQSQWPLWIALFGGLMMMLAFFTILYLNQQDRWVSNRDHRNPTLGKVEQGRRSTHAASQSGGALPLVYSRSTTNAEHTSPGFQLFRAKQNLLYTCDKIAKERGELSPENSYTEFKVQIPAHGPPKIQIIADHLSPMTLDCYQTVVSRWKIPATENGYSFSFLHHH